MYREDIGKKLIQLKKQLKDKEAELAELEDEISELDDLASEAERTENVCISLKHEIKNLEEEFEKAKSIKEISTNPTGDEFTDSFIKCSCFCRKEDESSMPYGLLSHVLIREKQLVALDGSMGIIIDCEKIPEELKNTLIRWDVRKNFKENAIKIEDLSSPPTYFSNVDEMIKKYKSKDILTMKPEKFMGLLHGEEIKRKYLGKAVILNYLERKVTFQKYYIDILLTVFKGMDITVYYPKNGQSPLIVEGDNQQALFLPVFLGDESEC